MQLILGGVTTVRAQTLVTEYSLFAVHTNAPAQVTVTKNGFSAAAHTADNHIAIFKLDNPVFDMSGTTVQVGSVYPNPSSGGRVSVEFSLPSRRRLKLVFLMCWANQP